jgi:hypothetical protein
MSKNIQLKKNAEGGYVTPSANNADWSYAIIEQTETTIESRLTGSFPRTSTRTVILNLETATAQKTVADLLNGGLEGGAVFVKEFVQSELPADVAAQDDDVLDRNIKRAGNDEDAVVCMKDGEPIYQFRVFMSAAQIRSNPDDAVDVLVKHDNADAIKAHNARVKAEAAKAASAGVTAAGATLTKAQLAAQKKAKAAAALTEE